MQIVIGMFYDDDIGGLIMPIIINTQEMIRKNQIRLITSFLSLSRTTSTLKKLGDADELSDQDINDILGTQQPFKQSKSMLKDRSQMISDHQSQQLTVNQKDYFYGLMPRVNQNFPICKDPEQIEIVQTPNQNLFKVLELSPDCSFKDYTLALNKYRTEVDMYGDQSPKSIILNQSLEFKDLLVPDSKYLQRARQRHLVNISIPGSIQCEDPRNFMELRPVEEFRHTPLVPISEQAMKKHKEMLERYHRKQFIFQVKSESLINGFLTIVALSVGGFLIKKVLDKEEERSVAFSRMKYQRIKGQSSQQPVFRI